MKLKRNFNSIKKNISNKIIILIIKIVSNIKKRFTLNSINIIKCLKINNYKIKFIVYNIKKEFKFIKKVIKEKFKFIKKINNAKKKILNKIICYDSRRLVADVARTVF